MSALKKITTKAKQLYKTGKFAKWTDAIKEASKSLHKKPAKHKVSGIKKTAKKKVIKKKATKKATPKSYHKDTKSHNVKISVMSGTNKFNLLIDKGINEFYVDKLKKLTEELATAEKRKYLLSIEWKKGDKNFKQRNLVFKNHYPKRIKMLKKMISETKKHIK